MQRVTVGEHFDGLAQTRDQVGLISRYDRGQSPSFACHGYHLATSGQGHGLIPSFRMGVQLLQRNFLRRFAHISMVVPTLERSMPTR